MYASTVECFGFNQAWNHQDKSLRPTRKASGRRSEPPKHRGGLHLHDLVRFISPGAHTCPTQLLLFWLVDDLDNVWTDSSYLFFFEEEEEEELHLLYLWSFVACFVVTCSCFLHGIFMPIFFLSGMFLCIKNVVVG